MMGWTTRHYRYFFRLICKKAQLYTEMLTTGAILNNPQRERLLRFDASEKWPEQGFRSSGNRQYGTGNDAFRHRRG